MKRVSQRTHGCQIQETQEGLVRDRSELSASLAEISLQFRAIIEGHITTDIGIWEYEIGVQEGADKWDQNLARVEGA
jgi:hypothetical protein